MTAGSWAKKAAEYIRKKQQNYLENAVLKSGHSPDDFFIYALTGEKDIAFEPMDSQIKAMKIHAPSFKFITDENPGGNICFRVHPDGVHSHEYVDRVYLQCPADFLERRPRFYNIIKNPNAFTMLLMQHSERFFIVLLSFFILREFAKTKNNRRGDCLMIRILNCRNHTSLLAASLCSIALHLCCCAPPAQLFSFLRYLSGGKCFLTLIFRCICES